MKLCKRCGANKTEEEFSLHSGAPDGLQSGCKKCCVNSRKIYLRTKNGLSCKMYGGQKSSSKKRQHQPPSYSLKDFREWLFSQKNFNLLYDDWVLSGYNKNKTPSADRLNDYLPYTLNNLQLITWGENAAKAHIDRVNGANNKGSKSLTQSTKKNIIIATHHSAAQAARATGISQGNISCCCRGQRKTAGGYMWEYKEAQ